MNQKIQDILQKVRTVLFRYPLVLAMSFIMASTLTLMIQRDWKLNEQFWPIRLLITSGLGISLLFAIKMVSQRIKREWLWQLLGLTFLTAYFFILPEKEKQFTEVYAFVIIPSFILSHLLVACIAFVGKNQEIPFWQFNKNLFIHSFLTAVFTGVLTGGVLLAILAVQQLFKIPIEDTTYGETCVMLSIFGSTFIFLLFNEKGLGYLEKEGGYPEVLKFFTQFILIPLLLIYVVILYLYSAKILLSWQLPEGWVSYLVLAYSILGILALLLVHPLKGGPSRSWVKIFSSLFYYSLLPLLVLLFTAIFTRLLQYGFTEARYYVLVLAVWLLGVVLYFILVKKSSIKYIPISLFLLGLFSLTFPYFNAFSVAKRSQKQELELILNNHNLLVKGEINFDKKIPATVAISIADKFNFLSKRLEYDYLGAFLDEKTKKEYSDSKTWDIENRFKNVTEGSLNEKTKTLQLYSKFGYHKVNDYDYLISQERLLGGEVPLKEDYFSLISEPFGEKPVFTLTLNATEALDLIPLIKQLFDKYPTLEGELKSEDLFIEGHIGHYHVKVVFDHLTRTTQGTRVDYNFDEPLFLIQEN